MVLGDGLSGRFAAVFNGSVSPAEFALPARAGFRWSPVAGLHAAVRGAAVLVPGRSVVFVVERGTPQR
jgi:hypothetical protein